MQSAQNSSREEKLLDHIKQEHNNEPDPKSMVRRLKCKATVSVACGLLWIVFGIVFPIIMDSLLNSYSKKMVVMSPENQNLWAEVPGKTGMVINRTYYFFNFTNPDGNYNQSINIEFLFNGSTPRLIKVGPFKYQEFQKFVNIEFNEDQSQFSYNYWDYMQKMDDWDDRDKKVHILNMFPLVIFSQIKNAAKHLIALQSLGNLVVQLEKQTVIQAATQGIYMLDINSTEQKNDYLRFIKDQKKKKRIIEDNYLGINSTTSFMNWVQASIEYKQQNRLGKYGIQLKKYFRIKDIELIDIFEKVYETYLSIDILINNAFCRANVKCDNKYIAAIQWSKSELTMKNPITKPSPSIVSLNSTASGYPEINYFYKYKFMEDHKLDLDIKNYQDIDFDLEWTLNALKHSDDVKNWTKDWDTLLHAGNLQYIFEEGEKYRNSGDLKVFEEMKNRFKCRSLEQTRIVFEYLDYLATEFAVRTQQNGTSDMLGIAALSSQGLYKYYSYLKDYIHNNLTNAYIQYLIVENQYKLTDYIENQQFIKDYGQQFDQNNIELLKYKCIQGVNDQQYQDFVNKYQMVQEMYMICDTGNNRSIVSLEKQAMQMINQYFGCNSDSDRYCDDQDLAIQEWVLQNVTRNIDKKVAPYFMFSNKYEKQQPDLNQFLNKYGIYRSAEQNKQLVNWSYKYLNFIYMFQLLKVQEYFIDYNNGNYQKMVDELELDKIGLDGKVVLDYMRYAAMQISLGGLTADISVYDLLYGYDIEILKQTLSQDPIVGGIPNGPTGKEFGVAQNMSYEDAQQVSYSMNSGKKEIEKIRYFTKYQKKDYISYMDIVFDGNTTQKVYPQAWLSKTKMEGTDGFINRPNIIKDDVQQLKAYVAPLLRNADLYNSQKHVDHFGIDTIRFNMMKETTMNSSEVKENKNWFQYKLDGFLNASQQMKGPMFQSRMHFLHVDHRYYEKIVMEDMDGNILKPNEDEDDSYLDVEPYTGVSLGAWLKLQFNFYFDNSMLLLQKSHRTSDIIIPIIGFIRGSDIPQSLANGDLKPLKMAIHSKSIVQIVSIVLGLLIIGLLIGYLIYNKRKSQQDSYDMIGV